MIVKKKQDLNSDSHGGHESRHRNPEPDSHADRHDAADSSHETDDAMIRVQNLGKRFATLDTQVTASDDVSFSVEQGTAVALTGPSGSGKSTLLHLIGALDSADEGHIYVEGRDLTSLNRAELASYRRSIGFVFQRFNLIPTLSVLDNVIVPTLPFKVPFDAKERAVALLERVGLKDRESTLATRLSGGQQQRVAIARALINEPFLLLADEPTGNLDSVMGEEIMGLLLSLRKEQGTTLLVATHDVGLAARCDRELHIRDGRLDRDTASRSSS